MQLFYTADLSDEFIIDGDEARHISKVLRKNTGDQIAVTDGKGKGVLAEIIGVGKNELSLKAITTLENDFELKSKLHLMIAPTKNSDRMEWLVEKATEMGVVSITPVLCERSERKNCNTERLKKVALAAMKQSGRFILPEINEMIKLKEVKAGSFTNLFAHCENQDKKKMEEMPFGSTVTVLIGPEGDFSPAEIELLKAGNFTPVSLGHSRLRTETAGIYAVALIRLFG